MSPLAPPLVSLARRKAALAMHHGADDPRTLAAASQLRIARLLHEIENGLDAGERAKLLTVLLAGAGA